MNRGRTGRYETISTVADEVVRAFVPAPLSSKPALAIDGALRDRLDAAHLGLGRLDSVSTLLPDARLFLYMYVRKEAVLSSQTEGTQSSLSDLLLFEAHELPGVPLDDVTEVSNYVAALEHGIARLRGGFPVSTRLIRETHRILLGRGRRSEKDPGEFRRSQNWIGGSRPGNAAFVPPRPGKVVECMSQLEHWIHDQPERTPTLVKAALALVQSETIHPFLDGNGRVGRLLVTLLLCAEGLLTEPLLYLSLFLKQHRPTYYELLDGVRTRGDWEASLGFFADGVRESAEGAVSTARRLADRASHDEARIRSIRRLAGSALRVHRVLQQRPLASANQIAKLSRLSIPTVNTALRALEAAQIVRELTGRRRNRMFAYHHYLQILSEGTAPPARSGS